MPGPARFLVWPHQCHLRMKPCICPTLALYRVLVGLTVFCPPPICWPHSGPTRTVPACLRAFASTPSNEALPFCLHLPARKPSNFIQSQLQDILLHPLPFLPLFLPLIFLSCLDAVPTRFPISSPPADRLPRPLRWTPFYLRPICTTALLETTSFAGPASQYTL